MVKKFRYKYKVFLWRFGNRKEYDGYLKNEVKQQSHYLFP